MQVSISFSDAELKLIISALKLAEIHTDSEEQEEDFNAMTHKIRYVLVINSENPSNYKIPENNYK